jgi:hypothetical protein
MTREQYITSKTYEPLNVVYNYYITHEKLNHKPLNPNELFIFLQTNGYNVNDIVRRVMEELDAKYNIVALLDKNGNLIKYI